MKYPFTTQLTHKRLLWVNKPGDAISSEPGLEKPEQLMPQDSQQTLMEKIGAVYTIKDAQQFYDTFSFLEDVSGINLSEVISSNKIEDDVRTEVMTTLVARVAETTPESTLQSLEHFQNETLGPDQDAVTEASTVLKSLSGEAKNYLAANGEIDTSSTAKEKRDSESRFYQGLAETIDAVGLKKDQLERTLELTDRAQEIQERIKTTQTRLELIKHFSKHVEDAEAKAKENHSSWRNFGLRAVDSLVSLGGAGGLSGAAGLKLATYLGATSLLVTGGGALALGSIGALGGIALLNKFTKGNASFENRYAMSAKDAESIQIQKDLLKIGKVEIKDGQQLNNFKTPVPLVLKQGSIIDGRPVTNATETAPRGAVISGVVEGDQKLELLPGAQFELKEGPEKLVYATEETLEKLKAEQEGQYKEVQTELNQHNSMVSTMNTRFLDSMKTLQNRAGKAEQALSTASQQYALAKMRHDNNPSDSTAEQEFTLAEKVLNEAKAVNERMQKAIKEYERIGRVFKLNEDFAKTPVSAGILSSLYQQTVNPEAYAMLNRLQKEQDTRTRQAQEKLGATSKEQLESWVHKALEKDPELSEKLRDFLGRLESSRGLKENVLQARFPALRKLRLGDEKLYAFCIALGEVAPNTRYAVNKQGKKPHEMLAELLPNEATSTAEAAESSAASTEPSASAPEPTSETTPSTPTSSAEPVPSAAASSTGESAPEAPIAEPSAGAPSAGPGATSEATTSADTETLNKILEQIKSLSERLGKVESGQHLSQLISAMALDSTDSFASDSTDDVAEAIESLDDEDLKNALIELRANKALKGAIPQLMDSTRCNDIMHYLLKYKCNAEKNTLGDVDYFERKSVIEAYKAEIDEGKKQAILTLLQYINEETVMSRFPLQTAEESERPKIQLNQNSVFTVPYEFLIYSKEELKKNIKMGFKTVLNEFADLKINAIPKDDSDETHTFIRTMLAYFLEDEFRINNIEDKNLDAVAANAEVLAKAADEGILLYENDRFKMKDGEKIVLYSIMDDTIEAKEYPLE